MTKELSKQLCELCGIKGKRVKYETETTDGCINLGSRLEFPDFSKPENFVKLFQLQYFIEDCEYGLLEASVVFFAMANYKPEASDWNPKGVIKTIIKALKDNIHPYTDGIKKAIREAQWVYD